MNRLHWLLAIACITHVPFHAYAAQGASLPSLRKSAVPKIYDESSDSSYMPSSAASTSSDSLPRLSGKSRAYRSSNASDRSDVSTASTRRLFKEEPDQFAVRPSGGEVLTLKGVKKLKEYVTFLQNNPVVKIKCIQFTDEGLQVIAPFCQNLEHFDFSASPRITDEGVLALVRPGSRLKAIIANQEMTDRSLDAISHECPDLELLNLSGSWHIKGTSLLGNSPKLRYLNLSGCPFISDAVIQQVIRRSPELRVLSLAGCRQIGNEAFEDIGKSCPHLNELTLDGALTLSDQALKEIARCKKLTFLSLYACMNVSNKGLESIAKGCPKLRDLNLQETSILINDRGVLEIANRCPNLEKINLIECRLVTGALIMYLLENNKKLTLIQVSTYNDINDSFRAAFDEKKFGINPQCELVIIPAK